MYSTIACIIVLYILFIFLLHYVALCILGIMILTSFIIYSNIIYASESLMHNHEPCAKALGNNNTKPVVVASFD